MKFYALLLSSLLLTSLAVVACGDSTGGSGSSSNNDDANNNANNTPNSDNLQKPDGSACGSASRTGETRCEASINGSCDAGQYCDNTTLSCEVGCTSDNNCAGNQYCDITDGVGLCRNCIVQEPTPGPDPDPDPDPTPSNSSCEDGGDALRSCGYSAPDTAAFITGCEDAITDPEYKTLVEGVLRCIDLAADCDEQATCLDDGDPDDLNNFNNTPTPTDNMCDEAATFALGCGLMDAAEAADFQATCEDNDAAGTLDDLAFCLSSSAEVDDCEGAEFVCFF